VSVNQREYPVIKSKDAKRFLENEKEVDERICLAGLGAEYLNNLQNDEKQKEIYKYVNYNLVYDLILDFSIYLEKKLGFCTSNIKNKDNIDRV
jgi:hypothetical protein